MVEKSSVVSIREDVAALPAYVPGARPDSVDVAKLSSNENPFLPPEVVRERGRRALDQVNRYPDMAARDVTSAVAKFHGVGEDQVVLGTGSSALLVHALTAVARPGSEVVYAWRSFESYPIATVTVGSTPVQVPLAEGGLHNLDAMLAAITENTSAVIVCNPNNPTGTALPLEDIRKFLEQVPSRVLVIMDEAYIDFANEDGIETALPLIADFPNVVIARTFSKAFALAGARVGYMIGEPALISAISKVATPFGVSHVAQELAIASLESYDWVVDSVAKVVSERGRLWRALRDMGVQPAASQSNFVWIPAWVVDPQELAKASTDAGVLVRSFPEGTRISIGLPEENDRVIKVFEELRKQPYTKRIDAPRS